MYQINCQRLKLKPGREKSLLRRHPWVFSGAFAEEGDYRSAIEVGETVDILDARGNFLARGAYSPKSQIRVRVWTWDPDELIGVDFFRARLRYALSSRAMIHAGERFDAIRLVNAESDGLPGFIVDRYRDTLVFQCLSCGAEAWRELLISLLQEITDCERIYERSDAEVRSLEGLPLRIGNISGPESSEAIEITEHGLKYLVDIYSGHKTGFYLDQRVNRLRVRALSSGRDVLDCFCYTGGFSLNALAGNARSVNAVDSSAHHLEQARNNLRLNAFPEERVGWVGEDVFQALRKFRDRGLSFDLIILDPPKFAPTVAQVQRASRAYKDINLLAMKLLRDEGRLVTFSCSGGVSEDLFRKIVAGAALDANKRVQILERLYQAPDHPVAIGFPEGLYLKGFILRVSNG